MVIIHRYLETIDMLYDSMVSDINSQDFTVSDKYKTKYEELGKKNDRLWNSYLSSVPLLFILDTTFIILGYSFFPFLLHNHLCVCDILDKANTIIDCFG